MKGLGPPGTLLFRLDCDQANAAFPPRLPFNQLSHLNRMHVDTNQALPMLPPFRLRTPAEPMPSPIKEPPNPMENPDAPVREPDPEEPEQI
jgi:hypothetical protein